MRLLKKWWAPLTVFLTLSFSGLLLADVVCFGTKIVGYDNEYATAKRCLGEKTTSDIESCEVYVTQRAGYLYVHSNYVSPGEEYPTKIATNNVRDLLELTANLHRVPDDGELPPVQVRKLLRSSQETRQVLLRPVFVRLIGED